MKDKAETFSISQVLKEETLINDDSIQDYQDDLRLAEKERLQSNQKRKKLLETLRTSFQKKDAVRLPQPNIQEELRNSIRGGSSIEIERIITQYHKQVKTLLAKRQISNNTDKTIRQFFDRTHAFLEKKKILEKVETSLHSMTRSNANSTQMSIDPMLSQLYTISTNLHSDIFMLSNTIKKQIVVLEEQITHDINEEDKHRTLFLACLSALDEQKRTQLIPLCHKKTQDAPYDARLRFYKAIVMQLVKINESVGRTIHAHIRKHARILMQDKKWNEAVADLCYALHLWKDDAFTNRLLADVFFNINQEEKAFIALAEVLRLNPGDEKLRVRIAQYWVRKKEFHKAIAEYRELLEQHPDNLDYRRKLGILLYNNKAYKHVPAILLAYCHTMHDDVECLNCIGHAYIYQQDWENAISILQQSIQLDPTQTGIVQLLSVAYGKLHLFEQAIQLLETTIQRQPDSHPLRLLLSEYYLDCDRGRDARALLQPLQETQNDSSAFLLSLGKAQLADGNVNDAITLFIKADQSCPHDREIQLSLARAFHRNNDNEKAEEMYMRICHDHPQDNAILQEIASFYVKCGQWQKATERLQQCQNNQSPSTRLDSQ
jgi:predicted Zn-dependent protease